MSLGGLVIAPCAGYALLHLPGRIYPAAFWGVDQLSYYPGWFSVVFLSIAAAAILIAALSRLYDPLAAFFTKPGWLNMALTLSVVPPYVL